MLHPSTAFEIKDWPGKEKESNEQTFYKEKVDLYDGKYSGDFNKVN